jgi:hypothetical protein
VTLAEAVWEKEQPLDWSLDHWQPGPRLQALDEWVLDVSDCDVPITKVCEDIHATCRARLLVAEDKTKKTKKKRSDSIGSVAASIVQALSPMFQTKNFPDDFVDVTKLDLPMVFHRASLKEITISRLLDSCDIEIRTHNGQKAYVGTHPLPVAEAIVRALLWGRSTFFVSTDRKEMDIAVNRFIVWVSEAEEEIARAISESALGTGYEGPLKNEVYKRLGIHPLSGAKVLPSSISL